MNVSQVWHLSFSLSLCLSSCETRVCMCVLCAYVWCVDICRDTCMSHDTCICHESWHMHLSWVGHLFCLSMCLATCHTRVRQCVCANEWYVCGRVCMCEGVCACVRACVHVWGHVCMCEIPGACVSISLWSSCLVMCEVGVDESVCAWEYVWMHVNVWHVRHRSGNAS